MHGTMNIKFERQIFVQMRGTLYEQQNLVISTPSYVMCYTSHF